AGEDHARRQQGMRPERPPRIRVTRATRRPSVAKSRNRPAASGRSSQLALPVPRRLESMRSWLWFPAAQPFPPLLHARRMRTLAPFRAGLLSSVLRDEVRNLDDLPPEPRPPRIRKRRAARL